MRLVDLEDTASGTSLCDEVHFGGVEIFNRGRWGAVCGQSGMDLTHEATVICGQMGFPSGSMFEVRETNDILLAREPFPADDTLPSDITWVSQVTCAGTEQRLEDCSFSGSSDGTLAGLPEDGVPCFSILGVVCHRFELTGKPPLPLSQMVHHDMDDHNFAQYWFPRSSWSTPS